MEGEQGGTASHGLHTLLVKIWILWEAAWLMMVTCELTRNFLSDVSIKVAAKFLKRPQFTSV